MTELTEIGPQIIQKFVVINSGPSLVNVLTVNIDWPFQVENGKRQGKWLLYLTDSPVVKNGGGVCTLPMEHAANPLNLTAGHDGIAARSAPLLSTGSAFDDFSELTSVQNSLFGSLESGVDLFPERGQRQRREVEKIIRPQVVRSPGSDKELKMVTFDCDRGTAKCIHIK